jgi:hypothetical protein
MKKLIIIVFISIFQIQNVFACASCGCSLISDWGIMGLSIEPGWNFDLRYDYINQNKLWSGTSSISKSAAQQKLNSGNPIEVENYTKTQQTIATLDYTNGNQWGVSFITPYIKRTHSTDGTDGDGNYTSDKASIGDARIVARYFDFLEQKNLGIQLGLKLPTGQKNGLAKDGVTAIDPGLQIGTGTTDLIVGVYYNNNISHEWGYFTQATFQKALDHSNMSPNSNGGTSYKPGNQYNANAGLIFDGFEKFRPSIQLNAKYLDKDTGAVADTYATGGKLVYLSPGIIFKINDNASIYGNVQIPIYQNVNGVQLVPSEIISIGTKIIF